MLCGVGRAAGQVEWLAVLLLGALLVQDSARVGAERAAERRNPVLGTDTFPRHRAELINPGILGEYREDAELSATAYVEYMELRHHILDEGDHTFEIPPEPKGEMRHDQQIKVAQWELERAEFVARGATDRFATVDPSSRIRYESIYRLHVEPEFAKRAVKAIKPSDISTFQTELGERVGPSTVATARLVVVGVLDLAVADDAIKKNPARSKIVQTVSSDSGEKIQAWSDERVFSLIDGHPDSLRAMPTIGATCGLREGELFGVAEEDIDFDEGVIHVRRQLKKLGKDHVFALPKNDRTRIVPMSDWTAQNIRVHIAKYKPQPLTLPWEKPTGKPQTHKVLFRWLDGDHMKPRAYSETVWKPALVAAGVIPEPTKDKRGRRRYVTTRKEGTHQLRHCYASVMLADGVNVRELAEYLGHADPEFTLKIYAHMLPDSHDRARRAIDARMFRPRAVSDGTWTERR
ncbi:MAG TPA: site-specific integrase [Amycolatopsis sp.]|uniref:tyrosine-type recombinase/integrase n=1 Tax=Amycolatopsis sp. TaxID=37632 RepID=UPI002B486064|nr:site-specific integrase [Amycolatopsis sp.]HJQ45744.1 site-specific integrase [Amycolatopsis sp.]HKS46066.1 site-specific integrase [Amycolatopsis sp.]